MINLIKRFWNWGWGIYHKNEELWNYLIFGALGVLVSVGSYGFCRVIGLGVISSNVISWIITVLFVYVTNKFFVFKSKCKNIKELIREFISFITARIVTLGVETLILYVGVDMLKIGDILVKVVAQIIIIILNYVLSKLIIFKKKK